VWTVKTIYGLLPVMDILPDREPDMKSVFLTSLEEFNRSTEKEASRK
jgi:hypothetical protein